MIEFMVTTLGFRKRAIVKEAVDGRLNRILNKYDPMDSQKMLYQMGHAMDTSTTFRFSRKALSTRCCVANAFVLRYCAIYKCAWLLQLSDD